jgi:signal transduction histidine kinase
MAEKVKFLMSFRGRLMSLLVAFLLLTILVVLALDNWTSKRADEEVRRQSEQMKDAVNGGFTDFALALGLAIRNTASRNFLYNQIERGEIKLPDTVEHIIVADRDGKVSDTTLPELEGGYIQVPQQETVQEGSEDPVEGELEIHGGNVKTYDIPFTSDSGLYWVVIVAKQEAITNQIDVASRMLASKSQQLSNIRLGVTAGLLVIALGVVVLIGYQFTKPVGDLASAARRVAAGDLKFRVAVERRDEIGQLASTFNEMIEGLDHKRELEERLNQNERAAMIGRLTQAIAHEIRNPLNVINLTIDHVASRFAPQDPERREQLNKRLYSIKDEISRLNRLLSDLLNYGRPARLAVEPIDMRELVDETLALVKPQADEQGVEVKVETDGAPAEVQGDRERLKSCLSNIAINALQAMPGGGHLTARVGHSDGRVEIAISDSGVGISAEALAKIFEPYYSTKQTGFGLGLAVTKWILEQHNGSINVDSAIGQGTTFTIRLPNANGAGPPVEGAAATAATPREKPVREADVNTSE